MRRYLLVAMALVIVGVGSASANRFGPGHFPHSGPSHHPPAHHSWGWWRGPRAYFFFGAPYFWDYPVYVPYPAPYYYAGPPPGSDWEDQDDSSPPPPSRREPPADPLDASYGLVQLRDVPDGADVDLDGRFWMKAAKLSQRWLALPRGPHTIVVRPKRGQPIERRMEVTPGTVLTITFDLVT